MIWEREKKWTITDVGLVCREETVSQPTTVLRRSEDVRVAQIAKERRRRSTGRKEKEEEKGCRARHGKSSRSFSHRVSRSPSPAFLARIYHPLLHSFARACTQPRARSLCLSSSPVTSRFLSLFLFRSLTPSPRGEGRRNAHQRIHQIKNAIIKKRRRLFVEKQAHPRHPETPCRPYPICVYTLLARRCRYASRTARWCVARAVNPSPPRHPLFRPCPIPALCPVAPALNTYVVSGFLPRKKMLSILRSRCLHARSQLWNAPKYPPASLSLFFVDADPIVKTTGWRTDEKPRSYPPPRTRRAVAPALDAFAPLHLAPFASRRSALSTGTSSPLWHHRATTRSVFGKWKCAFPCWRTSECSRQIRGPCVFFVRPDFTSSRYRKILQRNYLSR